jgi:hypothetical protein
MCVCARASRHATAVCLTHARACSYSCLSCKTVISGVGAEAVLCAHCAPKESELYLRKLREVRRRAPPPPPSILQCARARRDIVVGVHKYPCAAVGAGEGPRGALCGPLDGVPALPGLAAPGRALLVPRLCHFLHAQEGPEGPEGRDGDARPLPAVVVRAGSGESGVPRARSRAAAAARRRRRCFARRACPQIVALTY